MATEAQIFDFETSIERAVQTVFEASGVVAWQPADDPELRKERPRVEIALLTGEATGHLHPSGSSNAEFWAKILELGMTLNPNVNLPPLAHDAYTGTLMLAAFTKADHAEHVAFRARIRHIGSALIYFLDPEYHEVMDVTPGPASLILNHEDGLYETRFTYELKFTVKQTAWPVSTV